MKILLIGCGGIGSWLVEHINRAYEISQIYLDVEVDIADPDTVEIKNIKYQNFKSDNVLENKASSLQERFEYISNSFNEKVTMKDKKYKGYDLYIIAVDNFGTRKDIFEYCHNNNKDFIDLRAEGRRVFAKYKGKDKRSDLSTLEKDSSPGSCQIPREFQKDIIQYGNQIVAAIGIQMILNYLRDDVQQDTFLLKI